MQLPRLPATEETPSLNTQDFKLPSIDGLKEEERVSTPPPEKTEREFKYDMFCLKFKDRIEQWITAHSDNQGNFPPPPIQWDSDYRDFVWLNREFRRG